MKNLWETISRSAPTTSVAPVTTPVGNAWQASVPQTGVGSAIALQSATAGATAGALPRRRTRARTIALRAPRPELIGLMVLAGFLNLWALSRNGWANDYYSAAVRSMSSSWHNFLFGSLDASGVMTVDKPPLALWVQSLSVRVFGYHSLSILVPQALIGMATVALVYDLVRRRFGRLGGFVGGLALALTPITVGVSRHNNPDALLVLCCVAALWFTVRALRDGRTRWLVLAGVAVGLGFETKMAVALMVVPGIVAAWLWVAPLGRLRALWQLLVGGLAMVLVGGAWPLLVELTPASDRPWISGTSDNRILSLISEYNGVGRLPAAAPAELRARRSGRLAARLRARQRARDPRGKSPAALGSAQRLADRGRRRVACHRGRVQRGERHLPSLLRLAARAVRGRARRRGDRGAAARRLERTNRRSGGGARGRGE